MLLHASTLTRERFAPFGDVIECAGARHYPINAGTAQRYHDLAAIDVAEANGRPALSIFAAQPVRANPVALRLMERHPLASQAFVPLARGRFLVVVAPPGDTLDAGALQAFLASAGQGVNYARGVWHHPLLTLDDLTEFLVVDREGPGSNCDETPLPASIHVAF